MNIANIYKVTNFELLPEEIKLIILSSNNIIVELCQGKISQISREFQRLTQNPNLWGRIVL